MSNQNQNDQGSVQTNLTGAEHIEVSEELPSMGHIGFDVVEAQKLNLESGDVLMITIKNDHIDHNDMANLRKGLKTIFPNNEVFLMAVGSGDEVKVSVAKTAESGYCSNCSCGKKAKAENEGCNNG